MVALIACAGALYAHFASFVWDPQDTATDSRNHTASDSSINPAGAAAPSGCAHSGPGQRRYPAGRVWR